MKPIYNLGNTQTLSYETFTLLPCELLVKQQPCCISTILGSCVAVCLYDSTQKVGGMNHYMLPVCNGKDVVSPKYGDVAINNLICKMLNMGCKQSNLQAHIFGGADVIDTTIFQIGKKNIDIAIQILNEKQISIVEQNTGGKRGMKINFDIRTGIVECQFI